jgi:hypothetical protein
VCISVSSMTLSRWSFFMWHFLFPRLFFFAYVLSKSTILINKYIWRKLYWLIRWVIWIGIDFNHIISHFFFDLRELNRSVVLFLEKLVWNFPKMEHLYFQKASPKIRMQWSLRNSMLPRWIKPTANLLVSAFSRLATLWIPIGSIVLKRSDRISRNYFIISLNSSKQ